jgi:hypothetical protein
MNAYIFVNANSVSLRETIWEHGIANTAVSRVSTPSRLVPSLSLDHANLRLSASRRQAGLALERIIRDDLLDYDGGVSTISLCG